LCEGKTELFGHADCTRYANWHDALPPTLEWMRCANCGHVHTSHYWTQAGLVEVFRNAHASQLAGATGSADAKRVTWAPVIDKVITLLGGYSSSLGSESAATWVDIGCGDGALVMTASDYGFGAVGLDARAETVSRIQSLGFKAQQGDFMQTKFAGKFDVMSMMDVLEHMPFPSQALAKAAQVLRPGGVLVISLPDLNCSSWRMMEAAKDNPYWIEMEHHHNFSRQRLVELLRQHSFQVAGFSVPFRYKAQMEVYALKLDINWHSPKLLVTSHSAAVLS
jgi:2-polyprenyl-3-methyl-5-hydroxy-6-metoxy-1,4-benzoquinol methylase